MSLSKIQKELKAPKTSYNSFGKFKYRSSEDIIEAVKPLLSEYEYVLLTPQKVVMVGDRYYIETEVILLDKESKVLAAATGVAREPDQKKGMDSCQLSGAASSYSKKYALNNLFAIDDQKDSDSNEPSGAVNGTQKSSFESFIVEIRGKRSKEEINEWRAKHWNLVRKSLSNDEQKALRNFISQYQSKL